MATFIASARASIPALTSSTAYQRNHSSPASFLPANLTPTPAHSIPSPAPPPSFLSSPVPSIPTSPIPSPRPSSPSPCSLEALLWEMHSLEEKFQKANEQYTLVSEQLLAVRTRYQRAARPKGAPLSSAAFCWSLRPRVVTLENVCDMFWQYMDVKADKMDDLRELLLREHGLDWDIVADHVDFS